MRQDWILVSINSTTNGGSIFFSNRSKLRYKYVRRKDESLIVSLANLLFCILFIIVCFHYFGFMFNQVLFFFAYPEHVISAVSKKNFKSLMIKFLNILYC